MIDETDVRSKDFLEDCDDDNGREEVWEVRDGLAHALETNRLHLIDHERKDDGEWELQDALDDANAQRVLDQARGIVTVKEGPEVVEADPIGTEDSFTNRIVLEGER